MHFRALLLNAETGCQSNSPMTHDTHHHIFALIVHRSKNFCEYFLWFRGAKPQFMDVLAQPNPPSFKHELGISDQPAPDPHSNGMLLLNKNAIPTPLFLMRLHLL